MRIVLKSNAAGEVVLCDGSESGQDKSRGPIGYGVEQNSEISPMPGARAASPLMLERGNVWHTIRFSIMRECLSHGDAVIWANNHLQAIAAMKAAVALDQPAKSLSLFLSAGNYQKTIARVVVAAVGAPMFLGVSVTMTYQISFGVWPE